MLKAILRIQWRACWHLVIACSVAVFALPVVSVRLGWQDGVENLPLFLSELELWGFFYPLLAAVVAFIIAFGGWYSDRRGQHVYAMLLPLPRWRYVMLRYLAGVILLIPIIAALWLGAMVATTGLPLPPGIRTYPFMLAGKFAVSVLLLFALAFAFASASQRTIGIAIRLVGLLLAVHVGVQLIHPQTNVIWTTVKALGTWPGPLAPLGGRWMLIDA